MSEMALTADHVIVLGRGRLMADMPMSELIAQASSDAVVVQSPQVAVLADALQGEPGITLTSPGPGTLEVSGLTAAQIGDRARDLNISLHGLSPKKASLEEAFMEMTRDEVEYSATTRPTRTMETAA
jgi:ABC-2 type transport system ATP-binding protein